MRIDTQSRRALRLNSWGFVVLFLVVIGLLAWLSTRYSLQADWTAARRHTLSPETVALLERLPEPVSVTAYARSGDGSGLRQRIEELLARYRRHKPDLALSFVDPDLEPEQVRAAGVTLNGELVVAYGGRSENLKSIGEQAFTNALQRLARGGERRLLFVTGHGERAPEGQANHDLGRWAAGLAERGFRVDTLNLAQAERIPEDAAALVLAGPRVDFLPAEVSRLNTYLEGGGNLLWLTDPGPLHGLEPLAKSLGLALPAATLLDPTSQMLGIDHAAFIVVGAYPEHPATAGLNEITLYPLARPVLHAPAEGWQGAVLLHSLERAWAETETLEGEATFDPAADLPGPVSLGVALSRERPDEEGGEQRVAVIGDGDFLANAYLGNGANAELGDRLANWLSRDDSFIAIPHRAAPDTRLEVDRTLSAVLGFGFLLVLPLGLLGTGLAIWLRRRRR